MQTSESCPNEWKQMGETVSRVAAKNWVGTEGKRVPEKERNTREKILKNDD